MNTKIYFLAETNDFWSDQNLTTLAYQKEIDLLFSRVEHTICDFGASEQQDKSVLESADWQTLTNTIINLTTAEDANKSLSTVIRKALLENAANLISPKTQMNKTFVEFEPIFQPIGNFFGLPEKVRDLLKQYRGIEELYGVFFIFLFILLCSFIAFLQIGKKNA